MGWLDARFSRTFPVCDDPIPKSLSLSSIRRRLIDSCKDLLYPDFVTLFNATDGTTVSKS